MLLHSSGIGRRVSRENTVIGSNWIPFVRVKTSAQSTSNALNPCRRTSWICHQELAIGWEMGGVSWDWGQVFWNGELIFSTDLHQQCVQNASESTWVPSFETRIAPRLYKGPYMPLHSLLDDNCRELRWGNLQSLTKIMKVQAQLPFSDVSKSWDQCNQWHWPFSWSSCIGPSSNKIAI